VSGHSLTQRTEEARLIAIGLIVGGIASYCVARALQAALFGVTPTDLSAAFAMALLAVTALLACYVPARKSMRVDPVVALRQE